MEQAFIMLLWFLMQTLLLPKYTESTFYTKFSHISSLPFDKDGAAAFLILEQESEAEGRVNLENLILKIYKIYPIFGRSLGSLRAVFGQSSGSLQAVFGQSSGSQRAVFALRAVFRQSSGNLRAVFGQSSGSLWAVFGHSLVNLRAIFGQSSGSLRPSGSLRVLFSESF